MKILITGTVDFINFHMEKKLFEQDNQVIGLGRIKAFTFQLVKKSF